MKAPAEILKGHKDTDLANALVQVLKDCSWEAVALAHAYLQLLNGVDLEVVARDAFKRGAATLTKSRQLVAAAKESGFVGLLTPRKRIGSAENPVTKLFPATVTEHRFLELAEKLCDSRPELGYRDERETGHTLTDFALSEGKLELPINVKVASTRFEKSNDLVGLEPDDCIPIPAYKAYGALESVPNLLYVVAVDYTLISTVDKLLESLLSEPETLAWAMINAYEGARVRRAEDAFISTIVKQHWDKFKAAVQGTSFHAISARKAIRILQTMPKRTPGLGLRAWGTGAAAEVNVHISIAADTKPWEQVASRIATKGLRDILDAINRRRQEEVYDPEI